MQITNEVDTVLLESVSPRCAEEPASLTATTCFVDGDYRDHVDACKRDCKTLLDGVSNGATAAAKAEKATSTCTPWSCLLCWRKKEPTKPKKDRDLVVMPTEMSGVDEPLLRTLATVASKMYAEELMATYEDGAVCTKAGGEHGEGTKALDLFKSSLACYGKVVEGIIDWSGEAEAAIPPFAALIVQPKDGDVGDAPILILAWRGSNKMLDFINDVAFSPTLSSRWSGETKDIRAHGAIVNLVEHTFSLNEDAIVGLIETHKVERVFFTGHSLGGGMANVAHLIVRGQLKRAGSPWAKLDGKVTWLACTFAALQTIVRLYPSMENIPPLIADLDASSYNIVYGCDPVPRYPGMLKYLGAIVEDVLPKLMEERTTDRIPVLGLLTKAVKNRAEDMVGGAVDSAVDRLTKDGLVEVMSHFTHVGVAVYQAPEASEFVYLGPVGTTWNDPAKDIRKTLDVNGGAFHALMGEPDEYMESLTGAHSHFHKFAFGYVPK